MKRKIINSILITSITIASFGFSACEGSSGSDPGLNIWLNLIFFLRGLEDARKKNEIKMKCQNGDGGKKLNVYLYSSDPVTIPSSVPPFQTRQFYCNRGGESHDLHVSGGIDGGGYSGGLWIQILTEISPPGTFLSASKYIYIPSDNSQKIWFTFDPVGYVIY